MENKAHAIAAGVFLLLLGAATFGIFSWLNNRHGGETLPYVVESDGSVAGLAANTTVTYRGVEVGIVEAIYFDPQNQALILVPIRVARNVPIGTGTYANLRLEGITGSMQLDLNHKGERGPLLETSEDDPARIPMKLSGIASIESSAEKLFNQLEALLSDVRSIVSPENRTRIDNLMRNAELATGRLVELETALQPTLDALPQLTRSVESTLAAIGEASGSANELVRDAQGRLADLDPLIGQMSELLSSGRQAGDAVVSDTLPQLNGLLRELESTTRGLQRLLSTLENDPQSLLLGPAERAPGPGEPGYGRKRR